MEFNIPHKCVACKRKMPSEKDGIRLAPDGVLDTDLPKIKPKDLGSWIHRKCYSKYFTQVVKVLDGQHAVK